MLGLLGVVESSVGRGNQIMIDKHLCVSIQIKYLEIPEERYLNFSIIRTS